MLLVVVSKELISTAITGKNVALIKKKVVWERELKNFVNFMVIEAVCGSLY